MKVLVTGGAGFIGSHTVDLLLKKGYSVRILDSLEPPVHPQRKKPDYLSDDAEFILGDVCNKDDLGKALNGVDFVFHLAAYQGYLPYFYKFATVNDGGTALLYETIVEQHLPVQKVILGSSQAVYGEGKYECAEHESQYPPPRSPEQLKKGDWKIRCPICHQDMKPLPTDESRVDPHNQYAISKYCQELYALNLGRRFHIPTVALRYSITQGTRQSFYNAYSGILRIFSARLISNLPPIIFEDGKQLRDYVHVGDVVQANLLVMEDESVSFEVFNVGREKATGTLEYAEIITRIYGKNVKPEIPGEFRFGDSRHIFSDISRLKRLGWQPKTPLEQIIREYLEWAEAQPGVADYYAEAEKVMKQEGVIRLVK
ncbi:NAD-dependent epimerase/dehydratase family protein [Chloroflexota bacterium]